MIHVIFPDGASRAYEPGVSGLDVARSISPSLAKRTVAAVCNGVLVEQRRGASTVTWRYEQSEPMATYLATVQIGRYTVRRLADEPVPIEIVFPDAIRGRSDGPFARQGEMMRAFVRLPAGLIGARNAT